MATKTKAATATDETKPKTTRKPAAKKPAAKKPAPRKAAPKKAAPKPAAANKPAAAKQPAAPKAAPLARPVMGVTKSETSARAPSKPAATSPAADSPADMTKKELIERVVAATGQKPRDVRPIIEATLKELGAAVDRGEILRLNPFGVMKIQRAKPTPNGRVVVTKIKRKNATQTPKDPLAKAAE